MKSSPCEKSPGLFLFSRHMITSHFWSGDILRSRSVSDFVLSTKVNVPAPAARLTADWNNEIALRMGLQPGDVEPLPLARARMRWPDYNCCIQAALDWARTLNLHDVLATSDIALMACVGAKYHHDGAHYGGKAFCNLFLSEDRGLDLHFPHTGHRIPLSRGAMVIFDTGQPHAVIQRESSGFNASNFRSDQDWNQVFLSWELPIEHPNVAKALDISFDTSPQTSELLAEEQVWRNGANVHVCPNSGAWCHTGSPTMPESSIA